MTTDDEMTTDDDYELVRNYGSKIMIRAAIVFFFLWLASMFVSIFVNSFLLFMFNFMGCVAVLMIVLKCLFDIGCLVDRLRDGLGPIDSGEQFWYDLFLKNAKK